jgi:hypothetical protein
MLKGLVVFFACWMALPSWAQSVAASAVVSARAAASSTSTPFTIEMAEKELQTVVGNTNTKHVFEQLESMGWQLIRWEESAPNPGEEWNFGYTVTRKKNLHAILVAELIPNHGKNYTDFKKKMKSFKILTDIHGIYPCIGVSKLSEEENCIKHPKQCHYSPKTEMVAFAKRIKKCDQISTHLVAGYVYEKNQFVQKPTKGFVCEIEPFRDTSCPHLFDY